MTAPAARTRTSTAVVATDDAANLRLAAGLALGIVLVLLALALIGPPVGG